MKKLYNVFPILLIIIILFLLSICFKESVIPCDTKWYSSVNNLHIESHYNEDFQGAELLGKLILNDDIINLDIGIKGGRLFFHCEEFSLIMSADYSINRTGDIILRNITYTEEINWESTPKKLIFKKQGDKA